MKRILVVTLLAVLTLAVTPARASHPPVLIHIGPAAGAADVVCIRTIFRVIDIPNPARVWILERCYRTRPARELTQRTTDGLASLSLAWTAPRSSPIS